MPSADDVEAGNRRRRRLVSVDNGTIDEEPPLSGPEAYCARVGIEPSMMFLCVLLVFLGLQSIVVVVVSLTGIVKKRNFRKTFLENYRGLGNTVLYATFFPLFLSACYQIYLIIDGVIPANTQGYGFTILAVIVIGLIIYWATCLALGILR